MPFISQKDQRSVFQEAIPNENVPIAGFAETHAASVGMVIDESMSISSLLNREGWQNRQELIKKKIDEGILDRSRYLGSRGEFDYSRAAVDLGDPQIKTDQVLEKERREMLAKRREYAQDVLDRGNGLAQFLGMANAFMLDPISIATMPISLAGTAAKSLSIAGRALLVGRNAAAIEAATELAIQPFVYQHKQDIESPYTYRDALENIAGAAIGAGAIGAVGGGISGYLKKVRAEVESKGVNTPETESAIDNIKRMEETLESNPNRNPDDLVQSDIDYMEALEVERDLVRRPQTTPEQYEAPEIPKASKASVSSREEFILDSEGLADDFNMDMRRFNELDEPRIIQNDEVVNAGDFMKTLDDELEGIDSVLRCAYG